MSRNLAVSSLTFAIIALSVIAIPPTVHAQSLAFEIPPLSSVTGGPDSINLSNLGIFYNFSVYSPAGRGAFSLIETIQGSNWGESCDGVTRNWGLSLPPANIGNPVGFVPSSGQVPNSCTDGDGRVRTYNVSTFYSYIHGNGNTHRDLRVGLQRRMRTPNDGRSKVRVGKFSLADNARAI